jgi:hypothetical protein
MMTDSPFDPYRSPSLPEVPYAGTPRAGRPGWLTTLCVLCIVLGALGIMNSLFGAVGAIGGPMLQRAMQPKGSTGLPPKLQDAQEKFQGEINAVQGKYFWATVPGLVFRLVVALLLLIGGIRTLSLKEPGRQLLVTACGVAMVFEVLHAILQSLISLEMMTVVNSYVENLTNGLPDDSNAPPGMIPMMQIIVRASIVGGIIVAYLIAVAKIALYTFGLVYLRKKHIKGLFTP